MSSLRYLLSHCIGFLAALGFLQGGLFAWLTPLIIFGLVPLLEALSEPDADNERALSQKEQSGAFEERLLYLILPLQYGLLALFLWQVTWGGFDLVSLLGMTISMGICCGAYGINAAHELGHRSELAAQRSSKLLLLTSLYQHFFIEHNRGHHARVATEEDPASARLGEGLYAFWYRSVTGSFLSAWDLEVKRLERRKKSPWRWENEFLVFLCAELSLCLLIGLYFGGFTLALFCAAALMGALLLETVNYIEHYGLQRSRRKRGRGYETVRPIHSWNSDHLLSRALLFELSRHSDHHAHPRRPYQQLRSFEESYQLPTGYTGMILLALIPPLYKSVIERHLQREINRVNALRDADQKLPTLNAETVS